MSKKQFHQGMRLRALVERSPLQYKEIAEKLHISRSSLYNWFEKDELLRTKVEPLLKLLNIDVNDFYEVNSLIESPTELQALVKENEALKRENELLREQVAQQKEMIELLKKKR